MNSLAIRKAVPGDLESIKCLADANRNEVGFVLRSALTRSIARGEVLVGENSQGIVGFLEYHHRRDSQSTLYHIVVRSDHRRQRIGERLIRALVRDAHEHNKKLVQLKCPLGLDANRFYARLGFTQANLQPGKGRELIIWHLAWSSVLPFSTDSLTASASAVARNSTFTL